MVGRGTPDAFLDQFMGPKASFSETLATSLETLLLGMGAGPSSRAWHLGSPSWPYPGSGGRAAAGGRCGCSSTSEWHHVRYVMPMAAIVLAAGLIGYARLANWLRLAARRAVADRGSPGLARPCSAAWVCGTSSPAVSDRVPVLIDRQEAEQIWAWIRQVGPDDAVMADYEVSRPPVIPRQALRLRSSMPTCPRVFPTSGRSFAGSSSGTTNRFYNLLLDQGFDVVHRGDT